MSDSSSPRDAILAALEELENQRPTDDDYARIGRIALNHTALAYQIETLVWCYMKSVDLGHIATSNLGVQDIIGRLRTIVDWTEPDDNVAEEIEWSLKAFDILRLNRNAIVHGFNFKADRKSGQLWLDRRTRSLVFDNFAQYAFDSITLQQVISDQERLAAHLFFIGRYLDRRGPDAIGHDVSPPTKPDPLRPRPKHPLALEPIPHEAPASARSQRRALLERATKLNKMRAKDRQRAQSKRPPSE